MKIFKISILIFISLFLTACYDIYDEIQDMKAVHQAFVNDLEVPIIGVNTRPALGHLFNGETLDIITGLSTGGLYHLQTKTCPDLGNLNGDTNNAGESNFNVLDIVTLSSCVLADNCGNIEFTCATDINGDGGYNVLDIVTLANCVIEQNCSG